MPASMQITRDRENAALLLACHDQSYAITLERFMARPAYEIERCHDAAGVLRRVGRKSFDVVVLDLTLDQDADVDLVSYILQQSPSTRVVLLFEPKRIERAIDGLRQGAYFYLPLHSQPTDVAMVAEKALRSQRNETVIGEFERSAFETLAGQSPAMRRVVELINKVAPTDSTVLLLGESGTGKEVVANTVHRLSRRKDRPFVAINCAALPEALLESEMFGHVKGAFTGAERDKQGLFEEADGGTILLDEIGDMSPITQAKLLRVLQSGEIRPVGASTTRHVDVRVLAATNVDLVQAVQENKFREDLYFRLNVIQIRIPPLRERMEALPQLSAHFLKLFNEKYHKSVRQLSPEAMSLLSHYDYPGNVRELESIIAHAVIMAEDDTIRAADLPEQVAHGNRSRLALPYDKHGGLSTLSEVEADHIRMVLQRLDGNQTKAARALGISRSTLWRKMSEYGIERETAESA
ncbi:MAG: AAA domain-containing protein [Candidatus Hydrogenedens sp.]|nr:AAA domain-containing protein [Candidatus Hydrogenedens sp.]